MYTTVCLLHIFHGLLVFDSGDVFLCFKLIYRLLEGFIQKKYQASDKR